MSACARAAAISASVATTKWNGRWRFVPLPFGMIPPEFVLRTEFKRHIAHDWPASILRIGDASQCYALVAFGRPRRVRPPDKHLPASVLLSGPDRNDRNPPFSAKHL
jgi:hypothetical protein